MFSFHKNIFFVYRVSSLFLFYIFAIVRMIKFVNIILA